MGRCGRGGGAALMVTVMLRVVVGGVGRTTAVRSDCGGDDGRTWW